jgi:rare lipoprotein A (peptidoglycan hydrolase)
MTPPKAPGRYTLALRIAAVAAIASVVIPAVPNLVAADEPAPTLTELRAKRLTLIHDIADATDRLARAEGAAADATGRMEAQAGLMEQARLAVAHHAVAAFVDASDEDELTGLRRRTWAETLSEGDRGQLQRFRAVDADLQATRLQAEQAADEARKDRDTMTALRTDLEKTISDRQRADADAARARAAATASYDRSANPRAVGSTRNQAELMARFPFGPVAGLPAGLVATGTVIDGKASWYGPGFDGHSTASGAVFDQEGWTVASLTLPLGTMLLITRGDRHVLALVNDRGPYVGGRVLDLSKGVAGALGTLGAGVAQVHAQVVVPAG